MTNKLVVILIAFSLFLSGLCTRLYEKQFIAGIEHEKMPPVVIFSIYMGKVHYPHMHLLLESMRNNPVAKFVLINVVEDESKQADDLKKLQGRLQVANFEIVEKSITEFSNIIHDKLGIRVDMNSSWFYKMCDFKPTLALLFPEKCSNSTYKYWAYADMDVIWGNISRFSHWFQGQYPYVHTRELILNDLVSSFIF